MKKTKHLDLEEGDVVYVSEKEFRDFLLRITTCDEAVESLPDMTTCPNCNAVIDINGTLTHKPKHLYMN